MNIVIVGQGAIGLLWYSRLTLAEKTQQKVTLYRNHNRKNINDSITFTDTNKVTHTIAVNFCEKTELIHADIILICVKSYQVASAYHEVINALSAHAKIILCHNGMLDLAPLAATISDQQSILTLLTTHGSLKNGDWAIEHTGTGVCDIGLVVGQLSSQEQEAILQSLQQAMHQLQWHNNIIYKQWLKIAINCVINPLTALHNMNNGEICLARYRDTISKIIEEVVEVAQLDNIYFERQELLAVTLQVAEKTQKNCSSMRSDILLKRQTEIDFINGFIVDKAEKSNLDVPVNKKLLAQIKALEQTN